MMSFSISTAFVIHHFEVNCHLNFELYSEKVIVLFLGRKLFLHSENLGTAINMVRDFEDNGGAMEECSASMPTATTTTFNSFPSTSPTPLDQQCPSFPSVDADQIPES